MGLNKTVHNVIIDEDGKATVYENEDPLLQGSINNDIIRIRFLSYDDTQELVGIMKATRADGELAPAGLTLTPNKIDGIVYYDFEIGQQETEPEGDGGSWFTHVDGDLLLSVALIKAQEIVEGEETLTKSQIQIQSQFKFQVQETPGFDETSTYTFDIIEGFLLQLSLRTTYDYVDNIDTTLNSLIETNQIAITDLDNNKIDKDIISNLTVEEDANKQDYMIIQNDGESEVKRIKLEDIKDLVTKVKTVNNIEPDSGTTNITLVAESIPSNDGNLQTDIDFSKSEDIRIENKFDGEVDRLDDDLDDAIYFDESEEEADPLLTVVNADKLNQKEEENLDVNSAKNVTEQIDGKNLGDIFEEDGTTVKNTTQAENSNQLNNKNEADLNVSSADNATNATLAANATKVYDKTQAQLKEAMQVGTYERIKLLEDINVGESPVTLDEELEDGDIIEMVVQIVSFEGNKDIFLNLVYSSSNNEIEYDCLGLLEVTNATISGETLYSLAVELAFKKISFPSSTTIKNEEEGRFQVGKISNVQDDFSQSTSNTEKIKYIYAWRKKESE